LHFGLEEGSDCLQFSAIIPKIVLFDFGLCPVLVVDSYSFQEPSVHKDDGRSNAPLFIPDT
jgi:hypothetical protein